ncbi:MAG: patatin-like phospholipase family protein [Acidimicrobiia bacterium]
MALVLSGGLFRNAFQVGVLEALHERGFQPDLVIGVSSGAWNGACLVADQLDQMRVFWQAVARLPKFSLKNLRTNRTIFNIRSIIEAIPEAHLDFDAIARSRTRLFVGATRVKDFTFRLLELNGRSDAEIFAGLMASNLIPGLVGWPVKVDGERFVDGGFTDRVPYEAAIRAGARRVVVIVPDDDRALRSRPWSHRHTEHLAVSRGRLTVVAPRRRLPRPGHRLADVEAAIEEGYAVGRSVHL